jgi:uncharacterized repeat protein (TIGR01451 family)
MFSFSRRPLRAPTVPANRYQPKFEVLEDRTAPAVLDLTTANSSGALNGALFLQNDPPGSTGTGTLNSFVQIGNSGSESGYNTTGTQEFNSSGSEAVLISSLPTVTIGGVVYRELLVDINEPGSESLISLQELRLFLGATSDLTGFPTFGGSASEIFNLDVGPDGDSRVDLDASLAPGGGDGDLLVLLPDSVFTGPNQFVYVYSRFGVSGSEGGFASDGGFEEWAHSTAGAVTPLADLSLTKSVNDATPPVGGTVTFTITLTNSGPETATNVAVTDQLPAGLAFVSAAATQGSYDAATGVWTVGTVASGGTATLVIAATVAVAGAFANTAQVTASDQFDPDSTPANGVPTEDDQSTVALAARVPVADLRVTKLARPRQAVVGQLVRFTIVVTNAGPDAAANVILTDRLPTGLRFVSAQATQGTYRPGTGRWTVGIIDSGSSAVLRITVRVAATGTIRNTARVSSDVFDPNTSNNTSWAAIDVETPPLSKRLLLLSTFR